MKVLVRRVNEWDAPGMLGIYEESMREGLTTYERELPALWEFVRRVDRYIYGKGWTVCDVDGWTAGFCVARECFDRPDCPFMMDVEVYVAKHLRRKGVGAAVLGLLCDIARMGNKRAICARFPENAEVREFYRQCGFDYLRTDRNFQRGEDWTVMIRTLDVPDAEQTTKPFLVPQGDYERIRREWGATVHGVTEVL